MEHQTHFLSTRTKRRHGRKLIGEINVTPFVDVTLVLLIVFMVTAPLLSTGIEIELPQGSESPLENDMTTVAITITENGSLFLDEEEVTQSILFERLKMIQTETPEATILVRGDTSVEYGDIIRTISSINEIGLTNFGLVTEPSELQLISP